MEIQISRPDLSHQMTKGQKKNGGEKSKSCPQCVYTVERSLSVATSANTLAKLLLTSRDTFEGYIVMRGLSSAHSVGMLVHLQVI